MSLETILRITLTRRLSSHRQEMGVFKQASRENKLYIGRLYAPRNEAVVAKRRKTASFLQPPIIIISNAALTPSPKCTHHTGLSSRNGYIATILRTSSHPSATLSERKEVDWAPVHSLRRISRKWSAWVGGIEYLMTRASVIVFCFVFGNDSALPSV